ncbi:MAG: HAD family hydrolase [Xanthobacteraceae bacterium]
MISRRAAGTFDWAGVRLVAFDVDGTLYSQPRLRLRIAREMLIDAVMRQSLEAVTIVRAYRQIRERMAEREVADYEGALILETARAARQLPERVRGIVGEWMERRPLRHLAACRYPGVLELFAGLRGNGKVIGIFSDYPAQAKLEALGLRADYIVSAADSGVGILKPNSRGLEVLMAAAGATARQTVLIGDRADRDGAAAGRIGVRSLIRSASASEGWQTFASFDDAIFRVFLKRPMMGPSPSVVNAPS